jgi:hypothetical protein
VVKFLDCFQMRRRAMAGDADGDCELRVVIGRSFGCKFGQKEDISVSSGGGETFQCRRGGAGSLGLTGFREIWAAAIADSGEKFHQPGGAIDSGARGKMERRDGATYRHGRGVELSGQ